MRSTFKREYAKESLPDDAIKLTFREGPIETHQAALFTSLVMGYLFILLWVWLLIAAGRPEIAARHGAPRGPARRGRPRGQADPLRSRQRRTPAHARPRLRRRHRLRRHVPLSDRR